MSRVEGSIASALHVPAHDLPRLLYIGDVQVEATVGGSALLYRLLDAYPHGKLSILESNLWTQTPERRLRGVHYSRIYLGPRRAISSRLGAPYLAVHWLAAPAVATGIRLLIARLQPEAILTVAQGLSWRIAAAVARAAHLPLHLIVHDDRAVWTPAPRLLTCLADRAFAPVYRAAASRLCVSPYMRDSYRARYSVDGSVLYPHRAPDLPVYTEPPDRSPGSRVVLGYAGSVNHIALPALQALASMTVALNIEVSIYSPLSAGDAGRLGIVGPGVKLHEPIAPTALVDRLRRETDILLVPMGFDERNRSSNEHSFPSKLTDYTATGLPLLIWGPPSCSAVRWARDYPGVAEVVDRDDPRELAAAVRRLAADPARRSALGRRALEIGHELFSYETGIEQFYGALRAGASAVRQVQA